ncbi:hypothetical protein KQH61_06080 [bacterium]|nr:hypothetical protein [bacterium]
MNILTDALIVSMPYRLVSGAKTPDYVVLDYRTGLLWRIVEVDERGLLKSVRLFGDPEAPVVPVVVKEN